MKKVCLISLGCSKNLVDAEQMLGILQGAGYEITDDETEADILVVNTCCFVEDAQTESIECILELAQYKQENPNLLLVVTGCMAQRYQTQVLEEMPEVDAVIGTNEYPQIAEILRQLEENREKPCRCSEAYADTEELPRLRTTPFYTAYLKIAEGCDNRCTYCVIPSIRGAYRSRPMEAILAEAEQMAEDGVRELVVIAQDTTRYGKDLCGEYRLGTLLRRLCAIEKIRWVRVHYCYPECIDDDLLRVFREEEKLCSYFDIPIQHCNDAILKKMGRRCSRHDLEELIHNIRKNVPDAVIRTSLIVGFPGETEEQFEVLMAFTEQMKLERVGVFPYSREEGTPAYRLPHQVDEETKQRRRDLLMIRQSEISGAWNESRIGQKIEVLAEGKDEVVQSFYGRSYADSLEIDGKVFFKSNREVQEGEFVTVLIEQALEYDLFGTEIPGGDSHELTQ